MSDETENITVADEAPKGGGGLDISLIVSLVVGFGSIIGGMFLEGTSPTSYLVFSAAVIVFGGTCGAMIGAVGLQEFKRMPSTWMKAVKFGAPDRVSMIETLVTFAEKARREGLLVLEDELRSVDDEFMKKGVQLVVDGTDPELVEAILFNEIESLEKQYTREASAWTTMAAYSPTMGIIGTVMGLVLVLSNLSDAQSLGPAIAVAFVATFYGVGFANLMYMPTGQKIAACSGVAVAYREMIVEGIMSIQSGDNPRIVEEKLSAFLEPAERAILLKKKVEEDQFDLAA